MNDHAAREPDVTTRRAGAVPNDPRPRPIAHPSLTGTHQFIPYPATGREIDPYFAGYPTAVSVSPGDPLGVHVATRSDADCFVDVYRVLGCENALLIPRLAFVERLGPVRPHRFPRSWSGRRLSSGDADARGCGWPSIVIKDHLPHEWRSGLYVLQFTAASEPSGRMSTRAGEDALFIVRPPSGSSGGSPLLYQVNVGTWAAYHIWHNRSLYMGRTHEGVRWDELRASVVSLHRPGLGLCLPNETVLTPAPPKACYAFAFIDWLEREGISVDFCSGFDIGDSRVDLDQYAAVLTVGHDEYWTASQRAAIEQFRAGGGHTIFLGGNLAYWQVRSTDSGNAVECHKGATDPRSNAHGDAGELLDPRLGETGTREGLTGATWQVRPESSVPTTGVYNVVRRPASNEVVYGGAMWWWEEVGGPFRPARGFTVCEPSHWIFEKTGLGYGDLFGEATKIVGHEADGLEVDLEGDAPRLTFQDGALPGTQLLAFSDCRDWGEWDYSAWPPVFTPRTRETSASLGGVVTLIHRQAESEGMLVAAPTTEWVFGLLPTMDWSATRDLTPTVLGADPAIEQITRNILKVVTRTGDP